MHHKDSVIVLDQANSKHLQKDFHRKSDLSESLELPDVLKFVPKSTAIPLKLKKDPRAHESKTAIF